MQDKKNISNKISAIVCIGILMFMMCTIVIRYFTQQIIVETLGISNAFTDIVFFDNKSLAKKSVVKVESTAEKDINWAELYPFDDISDDDKEIKNVTKAQAFSDYLDETKKKVLEAQIPIEIYSTERLFGYSYLTLGSRFFESFAGWNFAPVEEYNDITKLGDNYFYGQEKQLDVTGLASATIELSEYCKDSGAAFLYEQIPGKISKYEDTNISGTTDFSNQNADSFLEKLNKAGINTFDLREKIHDEGLKHHDLFYNTDHHWKTETGLWAAEKLLDKMRDSGFETNPEILSKDNFRFDLYENWFLGSQGKKATLAKASPEDINLIYPKFDSLFHYEIPSLGLDKTGDFSVTYDMSQVRELDYTNQSPYQAFNYADRPLIKIENKLTGNDYKALIIHDSFSNCVIPFLALDIKYVDSIDLRNFTGSVKSYIEKNKPDIVIVAYTCSALDLFNYPAHTSLFDFR